MSILIIILFSISFSQWFNIEHQNVNRSYYLSYPENINPGIDEAIPLIINMHGYGGNAAQQQYYTQMDEYAHNQNMAVVYPQGLNNSWNVFTYWDSNSYDDVGFINLMIDEISNNFNLDLDRVYACGMSNGGYMAYRLACDLSDKIAAFGSVTGNFMLDNQFNDCLDQEREIPIIHFHGTADPVVNYYPPSFDGSLTVNESINFWSDYNNLPTEIIESINSNVQIYNYSKDSSSVKFIHYKVNGGGHVWFDYFWGFHASEVLIDFFQDYKLSDFTQSVGDVNQDGLMNIQDVILIVSLILNSTYNPLADLISDNEIDVLDVVYILNLILNRGS